MRTLENLILLIRCIFVLHRLVIILCNWTVMGLVIILCNGTVMLTLQTMII